MLQLFCNDKGTANICIYEEIRKKVLFAAKLSARGFTRSANRSEPNCYDYAVLPTIKAEEPNLLITSPVLVELYQIWRFHYTTCGLFTIQLVESAVLDTNNHILSFSTNAMFSTIPVTNAFPMRNALRISDDPKVWLSGNMFKRSSSTGTRRR